MFEDAKILNGSALNRMLVVTEATIKREVDNEWLRDKLLNSEPYETAPSKRVAVVVEPEKNRFSVTLDGEALFTYENEEWMPHVLATLRVGTLRQYDDHESLWISVHGTWLLAEKK